MKLFTQTTLNIVLTLAIIILGAFTVTNTEEIDYLQGRQMEIGAQQGVDQKTTDFHVKAVNDRVKFVEDDLRQLIDRFKELSGNTEAGNTEAGNNKQAEQITNRVVDSLFREIVKVRSARPLATR